MYLIRMALVALVGLAAIVPLAWLTSWAFAFLSFGCLLAGAGAHQLQSVHPAYVPLWASGATAKMSFGVIGFLSLVLPVGIGLMVGRWWWGLAGLSLGGIGAGLAGGAIPMLLRLPAGLLILLVTIIAWAGR